MTRMQYTFTLGQVQWGVDGTLLSHLRGSVLRTNDISQISVLATVRESANLVCQH